MLYAQTLGLNSWYIGGTFKKSVKKLVNDKPVIGVLVIGYGQTQGVAHKSKTPEEVSRYEGKEIPSWFKEGVQAALLAPTALNRQKFMLIGHGNKVKLEMNLNEICANENYGLIKYHFELGAGKDNFVWDK